MKTINKLYERWGAPMPAFFATIQYWALIVLTVCSVVLLANDTLVSVGVAIPNWLTSIGAVASATTAIITQLTVDWPAKAAKDKADTLFKQVRAGIARTPWYVSLFGLLALCGSYFGWLALACAICYCIYRPIAWLLERFINVPAAQRSNWQINRVSRLQVRRRELGLPS